MSEENISDKPLRVGVVGSRKYENKKRIKDLLFHIMEKYIII